MSTGSDGNSDDDPIHLGCEGHLAHPAAAGGEDGFLTAPTRLLVITTLPCYRETRLVSTPRLLDGAHPPVGNYNFPLRMGNSSYVHSSAIMSFFLSLLPQHSQLPQKR